jgi:hypothetical protein
MKALGMKIWHVLPLVALAAAPLSAQIGLPTDSAPPPGVEEGEGAANPKGNYGALDALPDWGGIWFRNFTERTPGAPPPSEPQFKGEYLENFEAWKQAVRDNDGVVPRERSNCSPPGMPGIMQTFQYPYEILFTPGRVTINQEAWMQTRTIWTDGREHPPLEELDPTYHGHATAHWDGDVLVVDTIGVAEELDLVRGAQHSPELRISERIYLSPDNPDLLVNEMRMEDPLALEEPFETTITYRRDRYGELIEFQCSENDRNPIDEDGHTLFE